MSRRIMLMLLAVLVTAPALARADEHEHEAMTGVRGEAWMITWDAGEKALELAEAIPADKYSWRPTKEVRSVSEMFMHIAQANYMFPMLMGMKSPIEEGALKTYDKSETEKAKVQKALKDSYDFAKHSVEHMSDADLDQSIDFFGTPMTKRMALMALASHSHEHLGQAVVYARLNKITPPWTARQNAAAAEMKAKDGGK